MAGDFQVSIEGLDELKAALLALPNKLRRRALTNALKAGARLVQARARSRTPVLDIGNPASAAALRRGVRGVGTVRKAISVRSSKQSRREGNVGVFVNVRPAKSGRRGTYSPSDPFYWRWLNFGRKAATRRFKLAGRRRSSGIKRRSQTGAYAGARFLEAGAAVLMDALNKFKAVLGPQIARLNITPKDPL